MMMTLLITKLSIMIYRNSQVKMMISNHLSINLLIYSSGYLYSIYDVISIYLSYLSNYLSISIHSAWKQLIAILLLTVIVKQ